MERETFPKMSTKIVNYREACQYLDDLQMHTIKLGLEAMQHFLSRVGNPEKRLRFVHVAGTNGKGSVSATITSIMAAAGYRVGLFTSPHLSSIRERFRINDSCIPEKDFARAATTVCDVLGEEKITFFEFTTALALLWFAGKEVDLVVLETGMGGRLDSTNVVCPLVSVITNVEMDHEAYLGTTLSAIAGEKAGIIKAGVPVVTAEVKTAALDVIRERSVALAAPLCRLGVDFFPVQTGAQEWCWHGKGRFADVEITGLHCRLRGSYQIDNTALAIAALPILRDNGFVVSENAIRDGVAAVRWPGRLEYLPDTTGVDGKRHSYLLDGAHNPAGVASLVKTLREEFADRDLIVVWGAMADKEHTLMLPAIAGLASLLILTSPVSERAATPEALSRFVPPEKAEICRLIADSREAMLAAEEAAGEKRLILVAGSLYLLGEIRPMLMGDLVDG